MTTEKAPAMYTRFYDQVLTEIEAGKVQAGVNLLVGMLDTVDIQAGSLTQARRELRDHNLSQMLFEDPMIALAKAFPVSAASQLALMDRTSAGDNVSSTGRRLFEVTRDLTFARALRERRHSFDLKLSRAMKHGQQLCLIAADENAPLACQENGDASPVSIVALCDAEEFFVKANCAQHYDLILAPDMLDRCDAAKLLTILVQMCDRLNDTGKLVMAGLIPHHLGAGWRRACLNWDPHCHSEDTLAQLATGTGLTAITYRDETGCIVWAEYSKGLKSGVAGEARHDR